MNTKMIAVDQCETCGTLWRRFDDKTYSLVPGMEANKCCDNVEMKVKQVWPLPTVTEVGAEYIKSRLEEKKSPLAISNLLAKDPPPPVDRSKQTTLHGTPIGEHLEIEPSGMQKDYIILTEEERSKGFVRPVRNAYVHSKCGVVTRMGRALAETYARDPGFYSGTFCCGCNAHFPVGEKKGEFTWDGTNIKVGT